MSLPFLVLCLCAISFVMLAAMMAVQNHLPRRAGASAAPAAPVATDEAAPALAPQPRETAPVRRLQLVTD